MAGADIELAEMLLKRGASMSVSTGAVFPAKTPAEIRAAQVK